MTPQRQQQPQTQETQKIKLAPHQQRKTVPHQNTPQKKDKHMVC